MPTSSLLTRRRASSARYGLSLSASGVMLYPPLLSPDEETTDTMTTDKPSSKFQILAAHIESQHDRWGSDGISGPEPLYYILGILHEAAQEPEVDGRALIEDIFDQMNTNFGPTAFDFDAFYAQMKRERQERATPAEGIRAAEELRATEEEGTR